MNEQSVFRYDGGTSFDELDGSTGLTRVTLTRGGGMGGGIGSVLYNVRVTSPTTSVTEYFTNNAVGHTVALTNDAGAVAKTDLYEAFGSIVHDTDNGSVSTNNRLANTKERDFSTGLDNHGFRYYDKDIGRYISRDPIGYGDGMNVYVYVENNPGNGVDPEGLATGSSTKRSWWQSLKDKTTYAAKMTWAVGTGSVEGVGHGLKLGYQGVKELTEEMGGRAVDAVQLGGLAIREATGGELYEFTPYSKMGEEVAARRNIDAKKFYKETALQFATLGSKNIGDNLGDVILGDKTVDEASKSMLAQGFVQGTFAGAVKIMKIQADAAALKQQAGPPAAEASPAGGATGAANAKPNFVVVKSNPVQPSTTGLTAAEIAMRARYAAGIGPKSGIRPVLPQQAQTSAPAVAASGEAAGPSGLTSAQLKAIVVEAHGTLPEIAGKMRTTTINEHQSGHLSGTGSVKPAPSVRQVLSKHGIKDVPSHGKNLKLPGKAGHHGEQRGIKHGQNTGDRVVRQVSASKAKHQGKACKHCKKQQDIHDVDNPTGAQE